MAIIRNRYLKKLTVNTLTEAEMRAEILATKRRLMPDLPDENDSSLVMRMIDLFVIYAQKYLRDYLETVINEGFLSTASLYESVYLHAIRNGYTPRQEIAATATLTFTVSRTLTQDLVISKDTYKFTTIIEGTEDPVSFELVEDLTIPSGAAAGSNHQAAIIQGETVTGEILGVSDGEEAQEYETAQGYVLATGIKVYVDDVEWSVVDNMLVADPDDKVYEILEYTEDGHLIIGFGTGDGISSGHGESPGIDAEITIDYRILPGGVNGNVAADKITRVSPSTSSFTVTNTAAADDWSERESLDSIRWNAERTAEMKDGITKESHYITKAEAIDGIGRVYMIFGAWGENTAAAFCLDENGAVPDQDTLDSVTSVLEDLNPTDEYVRAIKGLFEEFNVSVTVWVLSGYDQSTVLAAVETALNDYYDPLEFDSAGNRQIENGQVIYPDHVKRVIEDVAGVDRCTLLVPTSEILTTENKLPAIGTITLMAGA